MAYPAAVDSWLRSSTQAPGVAALQRALLWAVGAGGAIVYIEPSPYEFATLAAMVVFFATGLRMRLAFVPLLMLLFLINIGYTICAIHLMDKTPIVNWIMTSRYMAVTVIFFALVFSEDTEARLDLMRRGLIAGAVVASVAGVAGYFHLVPGEHDVLTLYATCCPRLTGSFPSTGAARTLTGAVRSEISDHGLGFAGRFVPVRRSDYINCGCLP